MKRTLAGFFAFIGAFLAVYFFIRQRVTEEALDATTPSSAATRTPEEMSAAATPQRSSAFTSPDKKPPTLTPAELASALSSGSLTWIDAWRSGLSRLDAASQWNVASDPRLQSRLEAKALKNSIALACATFSLDTFEENSKPLVREWCGSLVEVGHDEFARQGKALGEDIELATAPFNALGARKLKAPEAERTLERELIEAQLAAAKDPWTVAAATRNLWKHRSAQLAEDWSAIDSLSQFQQGRLQRLVVSHAACLAVGDCSANSVWTVDICGLPGMTCAAGSSFDVLVNQNLSAHESTLESSLVRNVLSRIRKN